MNCSALVLPPVSAPKLTLQTTENRLASSPPGCYSLTRYAQNSIHHH